MKNKVLIIRFSSLGDIFHSMFALSPLKQNLNAEIHWLVRSDFANIVESNPLIDKVISFNRSNGLKGLIQLAQQLSKNNYTHVYDAHNNPRSHIVSWLIKSNHFVRRSKNRLKRLLFFKFRINLLPNPFRGGDSFIQPIKIWFKEGAGIADKTIQLITPLVKDLPKQYIAIAPSAAWDLKKWPVESWIKLISMMPNRKFVILGGPEDLFCEDIASAFKDRVVNMSGKLSWLESASVIQHSQAVVSGDTGIFHIADYLGKANVGLIGPSAFGFPTRQSSNYITLGLNCQPCSKDGRGKCKNKQYKKCLIDISPELVKNKLEQL